MPFSLEELERDAHTSGNAVVSALLCRILDDSVSRDTIEKQKEEIIDLKRKIREQDQSIFAIQTAPEN